MKKLILILVIAAAVMGCEKEARQTSNVYYYDVQLLKGIRYVYTFRLVNNPTTFRLSSWQFMTPRQVVESFGFPYYP